MKISGCWLRAALAWSLVASSLLVLAQPAHAEKRVALVIGNNDYKNIPEAAEGGKRRPHHGRYAEETRLFAVLIAENEKRKAFSETLLAFDNAH